MSQDHDAEASTVALAPCRSRPVQRAMSKLMTDRLGERQALQRATRPDRPKSLKCVVSTTRIPLLKDGPFAETKELLAG